LVGQNGGFHRRPGATLLVAVRQPHAPWDAVADSGKRLAAALLGPSIHSLARDLILLIQPDRELARIPWASLPLASGETLGERFLVAVVPQHIASETWPQLANFPIHRMLTIAATSIHPKWEADYLPLPGVREEIAAIQAAFPGVTSLEGDSATVSKVERALRAAGGLHFAGHASVSADGVRLLVAPDFRSEDSAAREGLWTPTIADGGKLNLAVLSACSTARYEDEDTLEPNDLARTLMLGGVRQVLAALWNTDSAAASMYIQIFYADLSKGQTPIQAARHASREIRRQSAWSHPYYWAPFTLFVQV
jgi:CHAT domain-containing protein